MLESDRNHACKNGCQYVTLLISGYIATVELANLPDP